MALRAIKEHLTRAKCPQKRANLRTDRTEVTRRSVPHDPLSERSGRADDRPPGSAISLAMCQPIMTAYRQRAPPCAAGPCLITLTPICRPRTCAPLPGPVRSSVGTARLCWWQPALEVGLLLPQPGFGGSPACRRRRGRALDVNSWGDVRRRRARRCPCPSPACSATQAHRR